MVTNPYETTDNGPKENAYCRIAVTPIVYLKRSYALIEGKYLLFLAIVFCGMILGSLAPMALLLGPMIVGINLCFLDLEAERKVEFSTVFNGMSQFLDCFLVTLVMLLVNLVFTCCVLIVAVVVVAVGTSITQDNSGLPIALMIAGLSIFYLLIMFASIALYMPFMFSFALIADRKLPAKLAMIASARAVYSNLWPLLCLMTCLMFISILASLLCYIPAILLAPINFGAFFLIYRDLFPKSETPLDPDVPLAPEAEPQPAS